LTAASDLSSDLAFVDRRFLDDRHAVRIVGMRHAQRAALLFV
jgi:hypothetical protein